ncbi:hypothetical protein BO94DRAFT_135216 [Aspergillus sclerotioniger CBS 115572]|uniref:Uncharacterized protein n=1 Tax=Aspergillus sclerotioniger CBS 115572 TaxID=1450535 RepID=A0A317XCA7_9EURO|nr:hypothetical protein BO94DRAFT_135216 [Aspergillus sclerotioniger CBS 115572]PWY95741.1 hypothetical protein BO94DRAFT_135216 [Aspergillus sclerotioniger CBS 115572]
MQGQPGSTPHGNLYPLACCRGARRSPGRRRAKMGYVSLQHGWLTVPKQGRGVSSVEGWLIDRILAALEVFLLLVYSVNPLGFLFILVRLASTPQLLTQQS